MCRYVAITLLLLVTKNTVTVPTPLRFTIDCNGSDEKTSLYRARNLRGKSENLLNRYFDVESFCSLIHNAIPKAIEDGKFVLNYSDMDQNGYSDTQVPIVVAPPNGFIPTLSKLSLPKLKVPTMNVPKLRPHSGKHFKTPSIGTVPFATFKEVEEESSAEKVEKFKKGVQKLLRVVRVLGQIDQYLSERTRIIVEKLVKTLAE